jgi:hypothetical protein
VRQYIQQHYLDGEAVSFDKGQVVAMVERKAQRLRHVGLGDGSGSEWSCAREHVNTFYSNIIGAVEQSDRIKTDTIFEIVTASPGKRVGTLIVNMFEATVLRYFAKCSIETLAMY